MIAIHQSKGQIPTKWTTSIMSQVLQYKNNYRLYDPHIHLYFHHVYGQ